MGKYLDLARKPFAGTTNTTEHDRSPPQAPLIVFGRIGRTCKVLEQRCPHHVPIGRWQQAVEDGRRFMARWGKQAEALGWDAQDLFGLAQAPAQPHPSYRRLSRYDETGLIWLLCGRQVVALTEATAAIQSSTGATTIYRRHYKPALGPVGDNLDDLGPPFGGKTSDGR
jgi:hypothetical protein